MTTIENNLKTLGEIRDEIIARLQKNTADQQDVQRDVNNALSDVTIEGDKHKAAVGSAKLALERARDFSCFIRKQGDGGSTFQHEKLRQLEDEAKRLKSESDTAEGIFKQSEKVLKEAQTKFDALHEERGTLILERDRTLADIERLITH